jgi:type II secretory pathway component PulF
MSLHALFLWLLKWLGALAGNYTFEPIMILMMGGVVLFIVLAMLLPIFELNQIPL